MKRFIALAALACALAPAAANASTPEAFCAYTEQTINDPGFSFAGWRCEAGPSHDGHKTVLVYVKVTKVATGKTKLLLVWAEVKKPFDHSVVLGSGSVPYYGYKPNTILAASGVPTA